MSTRRKCVCCGKEYDYCPNCAKKSQPGWMVTFCSVECKELFNVISAYNVKRVGKSAVQKFIADHKIQNTSRYTESIRKVLEETKPDEAPKISEPVVAEKVVIEEPIENKVIPTEKESHSKARHKKRGRR